MSKNKDNLNFEPFILKKKISSSYILQGCPPKLLELKKKFVNTFYKHIMQNTLVFHSYDKISSIHISNSKYQSTNVIQKINLIQMST